MLAAILLSIVVGIIAYFVATLFTDEFKSRIIGLIAFVLVLVFHFGVGR